MSCLNFLSVYTTATVKTANVYLVNILNSFYLLIQCSFSAIVLISTSLVSLPIHIIFLLVHRLIELDSFCMRSKRVAGTRIQKEKHKSLYKQINRKLLYYTKLTDRAMSSSRIIHNH